MGSRSTCPDDVKGRMLRVPSLLDELIAQGRWPRTQEEERAQNLRPLVPPERIRALAAEESRLYLFSPPFLTVRQRSHQNPFWLSVQCAPTEIDFDLSLDIGDFGLGSDAPIILDYRVNGEDPAVLRLRWSNAGTENHWIVAAPNFQTFVELLGL